MQGPDPAPLVGPLLPAAAALAAALGGERGAGLARAGGCSRGRAGLCLLVPSPIHAPCSAWPCPMCGLFPPGGSSVLFQGLLGKDEGLEQRRPGADPGCSTTAGARLCSVPPDPSPSVPAATAPAATALLQLHLQWEWDFCAALLLPAGAPNKRRCSQLILVTFGFVDPGGPPIPLSHQVRLCPCSRGFRPGRCGACRAADNAALPSVRCHRSRCAAGQGELHGGGTSLVSATSQDPRGFCRYTVH